MAGPMGREGYAQRPLAYGWVDPRLGRVLRLPLFRITIGMNWGNRITWM